MSDRHAVKLKIVNRLGLHARPAMDFVDTASAFGCDVRVRKNDQTVDGKSIMEMMMLAATMGTEIEVEAIGEDAATCLDRLKALVESGFGED